MKANKILYFLEKDSKGKWVQNHAFAVYAETSEILQDLIKEHITDKGRKSMGVANCRHDFNHLTLIG
jgi:glycerol kinase